MRNLCALVSSVLLVLLCSCASSITSPSELQGRLGQTVTVEGVAKMTQLGGPTINMDDGGFVMVERPPQFESYIGRRVRVTGTLVEVPDPIVAQSPHGDPAARQYMVQDARWQLLEKEQSERRIAPTGW